MAQHIVAGEITRFRLDRFKAAHRQHHRGRLSRRPGLGLQARHKVVVEPQRRAGQDVGTEHVRTRGQHVGAEQAAVGMARIGAPCRIGAVARIDHRQHALGEEIAVMRGAAIADVITVVTRIGARRVAGRVVPRAALLRGQAFLRRQPDQDEILQVDALLPQHVAHAAHQREASAGNATQTG
ncbi:hypothetical protein G6F50_014885 [Rhizopus delemar]|uniref:Uncharacterized protein n=1 Tax=Rhizopus delemar TaxID=936053 RepID=A0A9P7C6B7_9FUNG|nr:hypothetical protein G6F50_014885 [Rhizopus delemar]